MQQRNNMIFDWDRYGRILDVIYCNGMNLNEKLMKFEFEAISSEFCDASEFAECDWASEMGVRGNFKFIIFTQNLWQIMMKQVD